MCGTERIGPGWYVIERPNRDPARVVRGPLDRDEAEHAAQMLTTRAKIMHTPALVYSIQDQDYNVEWYEQVEKPRALQADSEREASDD